MPSSLIQFKQVSPQQFFVIHGREWIKCRGTHQFENFEYNAIAYDEQWRPGLHIVVDVKYFDDATLVSVDEALPLYTNTIRARRDNDN